MRDRAERFLERLWYRPRGIGVAIAAPVFGPFTLATAMASRKRRRREGPRPEIPVIAIGNLAIGGSGKTQVVQALAVQALATGRRVAVISRGYGGHARGPLVVTGLADAASCGDEPVLLARRLPHAQVIVARDRRAG